MAVNGRKFLELNGSDGSIQVTGHALDRIRKYSGRSLSRKEACALFCQGRQASYDEMVLMGYRPGAKRRRRNGEKSWYFKINVAGDELV
ncbi:MAG TPA: hypothetical protein ENN09_01655, partial [Planctomycetes bacterium]|nr:hypothetical protein [Planctomycetota bacterium]